MLAALFFLACDCLHLSSSSFLSPFLSRHLIPKFSSCPFFPLSMLLPLGSSFFPSCLPPFPPFPHLLSLLCFFPVTSHPCSPLSPTPPLTPTTSSRLLMPNLLPGHLRTNTGLVEGPAEDKLHSVLRQRGAIFLLVNNTADCSCVLQRSTKSFSAHFTQQH